MDGTEDLKPLTIVAEQLAGIRLAAPLEARFGPDGGTIGRADDCTLALPDPERHISRLQAEVLALTGRFLLRNVGGGNAIVINGSALRTGHDAVLRHGDELQIGAYRLRVRIHAAAGAALDDAEADTIPAALDELPQAPSAAPAEAELHRAVDEPLGRAWDAQSPDELEALMDLRPVPPVDPLPGPLSDRVEGGRWTLPPLAGERAPREPRPPGAGARPHPAAAAPQHAEISETMPYVRSVESIARAQAGAAAAQAPWWDAFARGAGLDLAAGAPQDAATAAQAGRLLRAAIDGLLRLLAARATARQALGLELTALQTGPGHPLDLTHDAAEALALLLQATATEGRPADQVVEAVIEALRDHTVATAAGVKAVLEGLHEAPHPQGPTDAAGKAVARAEAQRHFGQAYERSCQAQQGAREATLEPGSRGS